MARKNKTPEQLEKERLEFNLSEIERKLKFIPEPTYMFNVGDTIKIGALNNINIIEKLHNGKVYLVEHDLIAIGQYNKPNNTIRQRNYFEWYKVRPTAKDEVSLIKNKHIRLHFMNMCMSSIFSKAYYFGLNMDPDYQRDYVWTEEDKVALIDSIFNNIDIGKFCFIKNSTYTPFGYEILDGKQRIRAILDFYENKFPYKGRYFNDLCTLDKNWFENYYISVAETEHISKEQILEYFLLLNTKGVSMDKKHLEKVKEQLKNLKEQN